MGAERVRLRDLALEGVPGGDRVLERLPAADPGDLVDGLNKAVEEWLKKAAGRAKENGRGSWEVFDPHSAPHVMERLELESDLWRAIDAGELVVDRRARGASAAYERMKAKEDAD